MREKESIIWPFTIPVFVGFVATLLTAGLAILAVKAPELIERFWRIMAWPAA